MNAVFNKDSILKASKGLALALFGFVFAVIKFVGLFFWNAFFGQDRKPNYDPMRAGVDPDYDEYGHKY